MRKKEEKRKVYVKIYTKNGNAVEIDAAQKHMFVGRGFFEQNPKETPKER